MTTSPEARSGFPPGRLTENLIAQADRDATQLVSQFVELSRLRDLIAAARTELLRGGQDAGDRCRAAIEAPLSPPLVPGTPSLPSANSSKTRRRPARHRRIPVSDPTDRLEEIRAVLGSIGSPLPSGGSQDADDTVAMVRSIIDRHVSPSKISAFDPVGMAELADEIERTP